jgi:hypothetical protein
VLRRQVVVCECVSRVYACSRVEHEHLLQEVEGWRNGGRFRARIENTGDCSSLLTKRGGIDRIGIGTHIMSLLQYIEAGSVKMLCKCLGWVSSRSQTVLTSSGNSSIRTPRATDEPVLPLRNRSSTPVYSSQVPTTNITG